jgi:hypothetical protein
MKNFSACITEMQMDEENRQNDAQDHDRLGEKWHQ